MDTIKIIFLGLIAFAFDPTDDPGQIGTGGLKKARQPFDVYLTAAPDHVAELIILRSDLESDAELAKAGACERLDFPQSGKCMDAKFKPGDCATNGYDYAVWCLENKRIVFDQNAKNVAEFTAGHRTLGGGPNSRYFGDLRPYPGNPDARRDVSWVPELSKAAEVDTLKPSPWDHSLAMALGLKGRLDAHGLDDEPSNQTLWSWCTWDSANAECVKDVPANLGDYEQTFAEAMHMTLGVNTYVITLITPIEGAATDTTTIRLKSPPKEEIRIVNQPYPSHGLLRKGNMCIASHFKSHYALVKGDTPNPRLPYTLSDRGVCPKPHGSLLATVVDSFCPPTILKKP